MLFITQSCVTYLRIFLLWKWHTNTRNSSLFVFTYLYSLYFIHIFLWLPTYYKQLVQAMRNLNHESIKARTYVRELFLLGSFAEFANIRACISHFICNFAEYRQHCLGIGASFIAKHCTILCKGHAPCPQWAQKPPNARKQIYVRKRRHPTEFILTHCRFRRRHGCFASHSI